MRGLLRDSRLRTVPVVQAPPRDPGAGGAGPGSSLWPAGFRPNGVAMGPQGRLRVARFILWLAATAATLSCALDTTGPVGEDYQSVIDWFAADPSIPGVVALVAARDSVWRGASGDSHEGMRSMRVDDQVRIASLTKPFTACVVLQMVEEGLLSLDEPISPFFDRAVVDSLVIIDGFSYGSRVTVRMLLCHRSGVPEYATQGFYDLLRAQPGRRWTPLELVQYAYRNSQAMFVPDGLPPGEYGYCNTNYILLGMIVERVEGLPFHWVLRRRVLARLGLRDTFLAEDETGAGSLAAGYDGTEDVSRYNYSFEWASAGLVSTVEDVYTFLRALVEGRLFLNPATVELMMDRRGYGLGLACIVTEDGTAAFGHFGQSLGFVSVMAYVPSKDAYVVASMNQRRAPIGSLYAELVALVP